MGRPIDSARICGTQPKLIKLFYEELEHICKMHDLNSDDIWNIDEYGIGLGVCTNHRVLGASGKTQTYIQTPENHEWVSILEYISASGRFIRPLVLFKDKEIQTSWFTDKDIPDWLVATTAKGWTTNEVAKRWVKEIFIPETASNAKSYTRLLILDGYGSHTTVDFMWECYQNNIELLFLPAHSSHILQPLDLGTFAPLKSQYRQDIADLAYLDNTTTIKKQHFIQSYNKARKETFTPRVLRAGWKAAGIYPWNLDKALLSSQIYITTLSCEPTTPIHSQSPDNILFTTPKGPRDL